MDGTSPNFRPNSQSNETAPDTAKEILILKCLAVLDFVLPHIWGYKMTIMIAFPSDDNTISTTKNTNNNIKADVWHVAVL